MGSQALIIFYDGDCGFCERSVSWALSREPGGRLSARKAALGLPGPIPAGLEARTVILWDPAHQRYWVRAEAVALVLKCLPRWSLVGRLLLLPGIRHLAHLGYDWVAANRQSVSRWLGTPSCSLPDRSEERSAPDPGRSAP